MTFSFPTKTRRNAQRKNGGSNAQCGRFVPKDAAEPANADSADAAASTSLSLSELFDEDLLLLSDDGPEKHTKREWRQCLRNTDVSRRVEHFFDCRTLLSMSPLPVLIDLGDFFLASDEDDAEKQAKRTWRDCFAPGFPWIRRRLPR